MTEERSEDEIFGSEDPNSATAFGTIYEDARDVPLLEVSLIIAELSPRVIG